MLGFKISTCPASKSICHGDRTSGSLVANEDLLSVYVVFLCHSVMSRSRRDRECLCSTNTKINPCVRTADFFNEPFNQGQYFIWSHFI